MLRLSRNGIRNLASSDTVYSRGLQYYKNNRVINATFSKAAKQYKFQVKGSYPYQVSIAEKEDGSFDYTCNCPSHLKEKGACKHVVASLLFLLKYQEKSSMEELTTPEERKAYQVLDYFANQDDTQPEGDVFRIIPTITISSMLRQDNYAMVMLHVGNTHMYKVQSIKKFLSDYYNGENIILGKDFKFIAGESEFDKTSTKMIDFLLEIYEIQEVIDKNSYSKIFMKHQMMLTKRMLEKFLALMDSSSFRLVLYERKFDDIRYQKGNPKIAYELDVYEETILLDYREREPVVSLSEDGSLIYFNGYIYSPTRKFTRNYVPFYNTLGKDKKALSFHGEMKQRFLEEVLPKLHETMEIEIPEMLKSRYLHLPLQCCVYLDKYNNNIKAELKFKYGEHEFNCFECPRTDEFIIVRQKEQEYEMMRFLEQMDFEPHSTFYLMKNDASIYEFLTQKMQDLMQVCETYYSDSFKKIGVKTSNNFHVGLRISSDIDLLEMNLDADNIPKNELKALFRSFQLKKKYYRLKDGSFIDLEDERIAKVSTMLEDLNVSVKSLTEEPIKLSKNKAFYLDETLADANLIVEKDKNFESLIEHILNPSQKTYELPQSIEASLRPYQVTGYQWLNSLADNSLGGILADDMGLGKTLQSIVYIAGRLSRSQNKKRFLIVCPTSLVYNWQDEFETFAPNIQALVITGNPQERQEMIESYEKYDVLITSYPLIRRDVIHYSQIQFDTVFIDEAQFIKNASSQNAISVKQLVSVHRFALTGTPIENSLSELWSIFDFIMPDYLMSHSKFVNRYEKQIMKDDNEALNSLNRRIRPFVLRRMKKDVLDDLPEKLEEKIVTEMTEEQRKVYLSYLTEIRSDIFQEIQTKGMEKSQMKILAALTRLRQICCHPSTFIDNYDGGSGKLELLLEVIDEAMANGHRILVFSQFTSMLKIIEDELKKEKIEYFYLEGSTPIAERNDYVKRFNSGEGEIFLISLKAGGTGLNLVGADTVIHYDPWWNPAVEEQATDRVYRIGQKNNVHVIKLLTKNTIEEKIFKLQRKKKELSDAIIESKEVFINTLTREELEDIFKV